MSFAITTAFLVGENGWLSYGDALRLALASSEVLRTWRASYIAAVTWEGGESETRATPDDSEFSQEAE